MDAELSFAYLLDGRINPVFVVGHVRSGTGLVCRLLRDHAFICFGLESHRQLKHCNDLTLLRSLFPTARFVHVARDGRDVAHALLKRGECSRSALEAALGWARTIEAVRRFASSVPASSWTEIRYEDLVADPVAVLTEVAQFVGVHDARDVVRRAGPVLGAQVRFGQGRDRSRLSRRERACIEAVAGEWLQELGYRLTSSVAERRSAIEVRIRPWWLGRRSRMAS